MDTLIKFRLKTFGKKIQEVKKFVKTPAGMISTSMLAISGTNLATNLSRKRSDRKYQDKQLGAMNRLTRSINKLDDTVEKFPADNITNKKTSTISFKPKFFE